MNIVIKRLAIQNFKGIQSRVVEFDAKRTVIMGRNEAGKTTVADSFFWVMFGKDSKFRSKFDIIPLDKDNNPIHNLETSVECDLVIGNESHTLKRVLTEQWVKRRGTGEEKELKGTVTNLFIDGSPVKKTEYDKYISNIIGEERFKLLTSTTYFNEQMSWQDRRKILTDLIGEVTYEELVMGHGFSVIRDDVLKSNVIAVDNKYRYELKELNKTLESIPARIDEVSMNINRDSSLNESEIISQRTTINHKIKNLKADSNQQYIDNGNILRQTIASLGQDIQTLDTGDSTLDHLKKSKSTLELQINNLASEIKTLNNGSKINKDKIDRLEQERKVTLKSKYEKLNSTNYDTDSAVCPTCKQTLPEDQIAEACTLFESDKKRKMTEVWNRGVEIKATVKALIEENETKDRLFTAKKQDMEELKTSLIETEMLIAEESNQYKDNSALIKLQEQKKDAESELRKLRDDINDEEIKMLQNEADLINKQLSGFESSEKAKVRAKELECELADTGDKIMVIEKKLDVLNKLRLKYVTTIEGDLNNLFNRKIKIRLFEKQVNGGFRETCDVLVQNRQGAVVPWQFVNTGGQINASLQIINLISKHLDIYCPVFIDHAESVDDIFEIDSQVIELEKVTSYTELTVK